MVSKKKPGAEAGKQRGHGPEEPIEAEVAGRKAKVVKVAGKKVAPSKKAAPSSKAASSRKAASGKAAGKATPKKKKANKKSAATRHEVSSRTKKTKQSPAAGAREANLAAGYAATDAAPAAGARANNTAPAAGARDPFEVARETMKGSVPAIVEAMVAKAKRGSCTHAKTLLEMTGAKHMFGEEAETADSGEPWAKLVLERMDEAEQESLSKDPPEVAAEP